jgi:excinuclease ABC subunit C
VREEYKSMSREIIVPFELDWADEKVTITVPKTGEKKKLLDLSLKNAFYYKKERLAQYEKLNPDFKVDRIMQTMMQDLRLTEQPRHIECFDNSNLQGTNPVSACVVFKDGKPSKKDYRHFIPKTVVGPDDFATMREVVYRRYHRMLEEQQALPNLIIVDGGKGQLSSAVESLKSLDIYGKVPIIGIAKRLEELYYPEDELPLYIDKKSETLRIIQQLRDEAHRFAIQAHRKKRDKSTLSSTLESIEGIGPKRRKSLLQRFGGMRELRRAPIDELMKVKGISADLAQKIYASLRE